MNITRKDGSSNKRTWLLVLLLFGMLLVMFLLSENLEQGDVPGVPKSEEIPLLPTVASLAQDAPTPDNLSVESVTPVNAASPRRGTVQESNQKPSR
ncbi:hypothetical protein U27_00462 [Candidatus Vecturithrix granuli]|uniref:Uncharacterized protein n=1 Tax=Vecturithrix granuli TaxID=1499967 RepID=A0A081C7L0_VECG1|nr:hypothetical protein U27_00462 [Candidatus Vecturithrix granuli]